MKMRTLTHNLNFDRSCEGKEQSALRQKDRCLNLDEKVKKDITGGDILS